MLIIPWFKSTKRFSTKFLTASNDSSPNVLLPTTLTIALVNEKETNVDILYLWAGDSRGYLWNSDGLAQLTDDHRDAK